MISLLRYNIIFENQRNRVHLYRAKSLVLASDPDREGEAIAWHVSELMKADGLLKNKKIKVTRVTFNEITRTSVLQAMQLPRDISLTLVNAYLARRALDHLIGFALSPVLWRKLPGSRSAGRVQSAALRLVCERENEIEEFTAQEYWTTEAFACRDEAMGVSGLFRIRPTYYNGNKIEQFTLSNDSAKLLSDKLMDAKLKVSSVKKSLRKRNPPPPYMTSTLQQDAQIKLGFGASRTMTVCVLFHLLQILHCYLLLNFITFISIRQSFVLSEFRVSSNSLMVVR
jgi:DNA topoisomerase-1